MKDIPLTYKELKFLLNCVKEAGSKDNNFGEHMLEKLNYYLEFEQNAGIYV